MKAQIKDFRLDFSIKIDKTTNIKKAAVGLLKKASSFIKKVYKKDVQIKPIEHGIIKTEYGFYFQIKGFNTIFNIRTFFEDRNNTMILLIKIDWFGCESISNTIELNKYIDKKI